MKHPSSLLAALQAWAEINGLPRETGAQLLDACPWLDGKNTISSEIAAELLGGALASRTLNATEIGSLCDAYNAFVDRHYLVSLPERERAYAAMKEALRAYGEGLDEPFWIHEDSLSSAEPWVFVRVPALLSEALVQQVAAAASLYPGFEAVNFSLDERGDKVQRVDVRKHDA